MKTIQWLLLSGDWLRKIHMFMENRILNNATDNIPKSNQTCLTTIGNLYDLLEYTIYQNIRYLKEEEAFR